MADGSESEAARKEKIPPINLKRNSDGYPVLPSFEEIDEDYHGLLAKKLIIGKFMSEVYGS